MTDEQAMKVVASILEEYFSLSMAELDAIADEIIANLKAAGVVHVPEGHVMVRFSTLTGIASFLRDEGNKSTYSTNSLTAIWCINKASELDRAMIEAAKGGE